MRGPGFSAIGETMLNTERLLARVLGVPYAVSDTNRPVLTMWQMLTAQGRNPLDIEDFAIKAALPSFESITAHG